MWANIGPMHKFKQGGNSLHAHRLRILWLAGFVLISIILLPLTASAYPWGPNTYGSYRVVHIMGLDTLKIRQGPSELDLSIGVIPFNGRGIYSLGMCAGGWCLVRYHGLSGWVKQQYLAKDRLRDRTYYSIVGVSEYDVLDIKVNPTTNSRSAGAIPPFEIDIESRGNCKGVWCPIRYRGTNGWVHKKYLTVWVPLKQIYF